MNTFLKSILTLSVISAIATSLLSSSSTVKKYVNYLISLVMLLVIISPFFSIFSSFEKTKEYITNFTHNIKTEEIIDKSNQLIISNSEKSVCDGIKELVITKFGFNENDIYVTLECDKSDISNIKIKAINVILTNKASWADTDRVKEYLDKIIGCCVNVTRR